ncbi:MAG: hypothetical protein JSW72_02910 [Candidatus Bathyarchaeota archaeon]|nr:MAG: hypothetical protein JSW72_02910 [Candidatus Bathyarchaeota archaeon]
MPPQVQPELFALLGLNVFLALSLLSCLLDRYFPSMIPYLYQLAALTGFGQLLISKEFLSTFGEYTRFWYCFAYFMVAISNVIALNVYLAFLKKRQLISKIFLGSATVPAVLASIFFIYNYASATTQPFVDFSAIPLESVFFAVLIFDTLVLAVSLHAFFKPKWRDLTAIIVAVLAGVCVYAFLVPAWRGSTFVFSAMALGVAVFMVLGASIYVFLRLVSEALKKRRRR